MMNSEKDDELWNEFLQVRKKLSPVDPGFTQRVMASVRTLDSQTVVNQTSSASTAKTFIAPFIDRILNAFKLRPVLVFSSLMLTVSVLCFFQIQYHQDNSALSETTRIKGGDFKLGFLLKRGAIIVKGVDGDVYQPGDELQAVYSASAEGYLHLLSLDQSGKITCFSCQEQAPSLLAGQEKTLPFALELDTSSLSEIMIGYWGPKPIPNSIIESKIRNAFKAAGFHPSVLHSRLAGQMQNGEKVSLFLLHKKGTI